MTDEQRAYLQKARRALEAGHAALQLEHIEAACNRAYYAACHMATAALRSMGEAPRTHAGTQRRLLLHFVHEGPLDSDVGDVLKAAFIIRQRTDYDAFAVTDPAATADLIADVERFVDAVEALLTTS